MNEIHMLNSTVRASTEEGYEERHVVFSLEVSGPVVEMQRKQNKVTFEGNWVLSSDETWV